MFHIVHILNDLGIGGIQTMITDIINEQIKTCNVTLYVLVDEYNQALLNRIDKRVNVKLLNRHVGSLNYWPYIRLNAEINLLGTINKRENFAVHIHGKNIWKNLHFFSWIRIFQTVHSTGVFCPEFHKCEKLFTISQSVYDGLEERGYKRLVLAPNGINPNIIERKTNYNVNAEDGLKMVQVSRIFLYHKGQDLILEAMHLLKKSASLPQNMTIDFIGEGPDTQKLKDLAKKYSIDEHVNFLGAKDRDYVYQHLKDYDLFVQPSRFEGFGLTVAEAIAAGVPVLVSRNEGPDEIIGHGKYGISFENLDPADLAKKLKFIIENYNSCHSIAMAAYEYVSTNYNVVSTANTYCKHYLKNTNKI